VIIKLKFDPRFRTDVPALKARIFDALNFVKNEEAKSYQPFLSLQLMDEFAFDGSFIEVLLQWEGLSLVRLAQNYGVLRLSEINVVNRRWGSLVC
jgi:hypothetical protein